MIKITIDMMKKLCDQVNIYLRIKNDISYLKIVYKEILFPVYFTGKKKYFSILYEGVINFKPDNFFNKSIDTVKQGQFSTFQIY